ncbi:MAG: 30S ribosomal protein S7 [Chloroflexi bacterium]|nr:30S ribosomal protein S7 [Chloroflexota bacterium]
MPRRGTVIRRVPAPDTKYNSILAARFINKLMQRGKKSVAERIFYEAMDIIESRVNKAPLEIFEQAIHNVAPVLEVKPRRVGGATYQVPVEIQGDRRFSLAMRWLIQSARSRPGKSMAEKLANELMDASKGTGAAIKKKEDTHKMAEANKAFAHYRW